MDDGRVVDENVDPTESIERFVDDALQRTFI